MKLPIRELENTEKSLKIANFLIWEISYFEFKQYFNLFYLNYELMLNLFSIFCNRSNYYSLITVL